MTNTTTLTQLQNGAADLNTLEKFVNGDENTVNYPRLMPQVNVGSIAELRKLINKSVAGHAAFGTLTDANNNKASYPANTIFEIVNDPIVNNNGTYLWDGANLKKASYDLAQKIDATLASAQTFASTLFNRAYNKSGNVSNLFEFKDANDSTVVLITKNGDIRNSDHSLNSIGNNVNQLTDKINNQLNISRNSNLFEFKDARGNTVVAITNDGDLLTTVASLKTISDTVSAYGKKLDKQLDTSTANSSAYAFNDKNGNTIVSIEQDGDIVFSGGVSLAKFVNAPQQKPKPNKLLSPKEALQDNFASAFAQSSINNPCLRAPIYNGVGKQKYAINNINDFLAIRVNEPQPIAIDTPYFKGVNNIKPNSQVVHPYICDMLQPVHGYRYLVLLTPFHNTNDYYENPCVYGSNDLQDLKLLTNFKQPLAEVFGSYQYDYNSDNFAVYDHMTGEYCVFYRHVIKQNNVDKAYLKVRKTVDFINWTNYITLKDETGADMDFGLSQSIVFNPTLGKWMMHSISYYAGKWNLVYQLSDDLTRGWSAPLATTMSDEINFWHQETRYCGDHFITIINDISSQSNAINGQGGLYLGISKDGINYTYSEQILSNFHNPYKASISPVYENGKVYFNIMWTDNGNIHDGWRLYSVKTSAIDTI